MLKNNKLLDLLRSKFEEHKRIIFNGNSYDAEWKKEAKGRGLIEYKDTLSVSGILEDKDIIELFENTKVLNQNELSLRKSTMVKKYIDIDENIKLDDTIDKLIPSEYFDIV